MSTQNTKNIFIFIDESGDFTFSRTGTKYFILTAVTTLNPFQLCPNFHNLKYSLNITGYDIEYFHATEDRQTIRNQVFQIITNGQFDIDSIIVEKAKTNPFIRQPIILYPKIFKYIFKYIANRYNPSLIKNIIVYASKINLNAKKEAILKGIKTSISQNYQRLIPYHIFLHSTQSNFYLQIADYCCWAIMKKYGDWNRLPDTRPYNSITSKIVSEFEIFRDGTTTYY